MPIDLTKTPEHLLSAAIEGRLVLFIGAGISKQAESKTSDILPDWPELIKEIICLAAADGLDVNDEPLIQKLISEEKYLIAAQALKESIDSRVFEHFIRTRFQRHVEPGPIHHSLFKLQTPLMMTTNYDLLLEAAFIKVFGRSPSVATPRSFYNVFRSLKTPWEYDLPVIFKLHGTLTEPESIVLTEHDSYSLIYRQPQYRLALRTIFMTRVVLMMGFSFSDPDVTDVMAEGMGARGDFIVLPKGKKDRIEVRRLRRIFGVEVIEYEPSEGHPELRQLVEYLAGFVSSRSKTRRWSR